MTATTRRVNPLLLTLGLVLSLLQGCADSAFFQPNQLRYVTPEDVSLTFEAVSFPSLDGTQLSGWFIPAGTPALGTVIHFHGSYGNQGYAFPQVQWLSTQGFNLFTFDYRGFGQSEGNPSRQGIYEDGLAAITYLLKKPGIDPDKVFIFGQSLGGALSIAVMAGNAFPQVRAIACEGTFFSYRSQARDSMLAATREKVGDLPGLASPISVISRLTVTDAHNPGEAIHRLAPTPVLLIHGLQDAIVSPRHSELLYAAARQPKTLWLIDRCSHLEAFTQAPSCKGNRQRLARFFLNSLHTTPRFRGDESIQTIHGRIF